MEMPYDILKKYMRGRAVDDSDAGILRSLASANLVSLRGMEIVDLPGGEFEIHPRACSTGLGARVYRHRV